MKTVLITGASSGIGKETAKIFQEKEWNVVATMRSPKRETELTRLKNLECISLDVTSPESIQNAVRTAIERFGKIDVVVNNAGYGTKGLFEAASLEDAQRQFQVNVFGTMNVIWAILPHFRSTKSGTIINISSQAGIMGVPLNSLYNSSKYAIEGFSESLMYELSTINIKVKLILLAAVKSNFLGSTCFFENPALDEYTRVNDTVLPEMKKYLGSGEAPRVVAEEIYKAATDGKDTLRYLAGRGIKLSYRMKKILPFSRFQKIISKRFKIDE